MDSYLIHTGATNIRGSSCISECITYDSFFQSYDKGIPQNSIYIRSSRGNKNLEKGDQIILMGEINK